MSAQICAKSGAELPEGALICHHCKALTPAGRQARGLGAETEDQAWTQAVQAARSRQGQRPQVDPDEVLRQVVAQTGTDEQIQRVTRDDIAHDDRRSDYTALRGNVRLVTTMSNLLATALALAGLLWLVAALTASNGGFEGLLRGTAAAVLCGAGALGVFLAGKLLADALPVWADLADNSRRTVLLLRHLREALTEKKAPPA